MEHIKVVADKVKSEPIGSYDEFRLDLKTESSYIDDKLCLKNNILKSNTSGNAKKITLDNNRLLESTVCSDSDEELELLSDNMSECKSEDFSDFEELLIGDEAVVTKDSVDLENSETLQNSEIEDIILEESDDESLQFDESMIINTNHDFKNEEFQNEEDTMFSEVDKISNEDSSTSKQNSTDKVW